MKSNLTQMHTEKKYLEAKKYLKRGDAEKIAHLTGYSVVTIRAMLQGKRTMHPLVRDAIIKLYIYRTYGMEDQLINQRIK